MANEKLSAQDQADIAEAKEAYQAYLAHQGGAAQPSAHPIRDAALKGVHAFGTAMDYAGGNVRNLLAQGIDARTELMEKLRGALGQDTEGAVHLTREGDTMRALKGQAPRTSEYLERAGVPEGGKLSDVLPIYAKKGTGGMAIEEGGALDPSLRGAAGFVGDVVLDPLTYLSGGLSSAAKGTSGKVSSELLTKLRLMDEGGQLTQGGIVANAILNPIEAMSRKGAKSSYRKAFERVDSKLDKPETLAEIAQETGFKGSSLDAVDHFEKINQAAGQEIGDIMSTAAQKGANVDLDKALAPALAKAQELRKVGTKEADSLASQIEERVLRLKEAHGVDVQELVPAKTVGAPAQQQAVMQDLYHSVEQDPSRVLETETPTLFADGQRVGKKNPVKLFGANPDEADLVMGTRKRAFIPLEQDPKMGQLDLGFPNESVSAPTMQTVRKARAPVDVANRVKSDLNSYTNFNPTDAEAIANRSRKAVAAPLSDAIKEAVGSTDEDLLKQLLEKNARFSSTSPQVRKKLESFATQASELRGPFGGSQVDAILGGIGGHGAITGHPLEVLPLLGKKGMQAAQSFKGRTTRGYYLNKIAEGSNGLTDEAARKLFWEDLLKEREKRDGEK